MTFTIVSRKLVVDNHGIIDVFLLDDDLFFSSISIRTGIRGGSKIILTDPAVINRKKTLSLT